jgi:hypothetical protein
MTLEHAEKLRLRRRAHLADFVEQQRTAVGRLELADLAVRGAGEGPFFVTEQLALQQRLGEGGAVEAHKRSGLPRARKMQRPCHQFFAHTALAAHQHR